jgi:hypothetical protein
MKLTTPWIPLLICILLGSLADHISAASIGTAFTYQGRLGDGGLSANGKYDFRFSLHDAASEGNAVAGAITNLAVSVSNGVFAVPLDFGNVFDGTARWLGIAVRTNGGGGFTPLSPRQALTPSPYALFTPRADSAASLAGLLPATQLAGTVPLANLPSAVVTNGAAGVALGGTFAGNGSGLTNLLVYTNVIDARAYGAVGNGVADDTAALQNALNAARLAGKPAVVYIPAGVYRLTATLRPPYGVNILGAGCERQDTVTPNGTYLLQTSATENILTYTVICQQWLKDIGLRGPLGTTRGGIVISNGIADLSPPGEQFFAQNVSVKEMGWAVITASPSSVSFQHCYFFGNSRGVGLHLGYVDSITYLNCNLGYGTNGASVNGSVPLFVTTEPHQMKSLVFDNCEIGNAAPVLDCSGGATAVFRNCNFERINWQTARPTNMFVLRNTVTLRIDGGRILAGTETIPMVGGSGPGRRMVEISGAQFDGG